MNTKLLSIGHRGAAGYAPENTLTAIEKGISLGADLIEVDIQLTADQRLVVIHDERVDRTTNGRGAVEKMTFAELRKLDAGGGECIPEFSEVLDRVNGRVGLMAEIKSEGIGYYVASVVRDFHLNPPAIFASFLHSELLKARDALPNAKTLALLERSQAPGVQFALDACATHVGVDLYSTTARSVSDFHSHNLIVFVYTLNDESEIALARQLDVDGVVSDFPDRVGVCTPPLDPPYQAIRRRA
jgi:glycerophosphoryl diester phosphodiesterase